MVVMMAMRQIPHPATIAENIERCQNKFVCAVEPASHHNLAVANSLICIGMLGVF
jgi:hypothetical protein